MISLLVGLYSILDWITTVVLMVKSSGFEANPVAAVIFTMPLWVSFLYKVVFVPASSIFVEKLGFKHILIPVLALYISAVVWNTVGIISGVIL